jgi:hypothetical protein
VIEKTIALDFLNCSREWKTPRFSSTRVRQLYQARHDNFHLITDGSAKPARKGLAKLTPEWERIRDEVKTC